MRSNTGLYISRLDHMRAAAAFLVYCWHFLHVQVPFQAVPGFFLTSLFEEGHVGVALFMTLSGYLFAKIINGRAIDLGRFYRNRALRLLPLLGVVLAYWALRGQLTLDGFINGLISLPGWPPGTWSIVVEFHFYAIFPILLFLQRTNRIRPLVVLLAASIGLRAVWWHVTGEVQWVSYWTIIGYLDMFVFGMLWHEIAKRSVVQKHAGLLFAASLFCFAAFWHAFNSMGGFFNLGGETYPSPSALWIIIPAIQGLCFGALIVGYERMTFTMPRLLDQTLAKIGEVSYSIYLVQFIFYPSIAKACGALGFDLSNFAIAFGLTIATFPIIVLISMVTYELIEKPFLRWRVAYVVPKAKSRLQPAGQMVPAT